MDQQPPIAATEAALHHAPPPPSPPPETIESSAIPESDEVITQSLDSALPAPDSPDSAAGGPPEACRHHLVEQPVQEELLPAAFAAQFEERPAESIQTLGTHTFLEHQEAVDQSPTPQSNASVGFAVDFTLTPPDQEELLLSADAPQFEEVGEAIGSTEQQEAVDDSEMPMISNQSIEKLEKSASPEFTTSGQEAEEVQVSEPVSAHTITTAEQSREIQQPGQELLPTDVEEVTTRHKEVTGETDVEEVMGETDVEEVTTRHREVTGETKEMGLDPGTTVLMDETSESEGVGVQPCEEGEEMDVAWHPGSRVAAANNEAALDAYLMDVDEEPVAESAAGGRTLRKRGRPPKAQSAKAPAKKRKEKKEKEDEEVCFICFDGGDLVVCDRRGCPKVYHASCVNRDEAFFRAKGRWNCGWHICSNCTKPAHYMCYTCTFSLCKLCIDEAGFVRVRENKGFCPPCMRTVTLIESREDGSNRTGEMDFDDKSNWMYFFKDYWLNLKQKLSLTLEELTRAKASWKDSSVIPEDLETANVVERRGNSDSSSVHFKGSISSKKKSKKRTRSINIEERSVKNAENEGASISEDVSWASKELLDFVSHMKDGDESALSQFDVQALLLEYIKLNNLRDPRAKSQIKCDEMLQNLFGKTRVGHFEMLKLLESHFLAKVPSPVVTDDNQGGVLDPDPSQMDTEGNSDASTRTSSDRRRRTHNRLREKEPQTNLHDYAAIDPHNIGLIYLRRNLFEDLIDDIETFSDKVVGSFARIRVTGTGLYRLVQVVGTGKATKKYRTGKKNTDITLKILNLNKTEFVNIAILSNQEFSEEECVRLRQSIKCGFIDRLTVGEIQEKARVLQDVKVQDCLESEKLRFGNLRDRASEKGRRKELRECVEKLQLLNSTEELVRRLNEVPEIHDDPKMDPDYESSEDEEDDKKPDADNSDYTRESFFLRRGNDAISLDKGGSVSGNTPHSARKNARSRWEPRKNSPEENSWDIGSSTTAGSRPNEPSFRQEEQVQQTSSSQVFENPLSAKSGHSSVIPCATTSTSSLTGSVPPSNTSETEKMWHYKDPSEKVQGPFSLTQMRKWNGTGYFPAGMKIWRKTERQEDSILLTDALTGMFQKDLPAPQTKHNTNVQTVKEEDLMDANRNESNSSWRGNDDITRTDTDQNDGNWKTAASASATGKKELMRTDMWTAQSSAGSADKPESVNPKDERVGNSSRDWQSNDNNAPRFGPPQGSYSSRPVPQFSGNPHRSLPYNGRGGRGSRGRWNGPQDRQNNWNSNKTRGMQPGNQGYNRQPNWSNSRQQSSGGHLNSLPANNTSNQLRQDSFNPPPLQSAQTNMQGSYNNFAPTIPVQQMNSGWGTPARGNEAAVIRNPAMGPYMTPQTMNPVGQVGSSVSLTAPTQATIGSLFPVASPSLQLPNRDTTSNQNVGMDSASGSTEFRNVVVNQNLESEVDNARSRDSNPKLDTARSDAHHPTNVQGAAISSEKKQEPGGSCANSAGAGNAQELTQLQKSEPNLFGNVPVGSATVAPSQCPVPPVAPSTHPSAPDASSVPATGNNQNSSSMFPVGSQPSTSFQGNVTAHGQTAQPSNIGLGGALHNISTAVVPAQANSSLMWGPVIQANMNAGWGAVAEGNTSVVWGIPAQGNANLSTTWGTPIQVNPSANTGWGAQAQGELSANMVWGTQIQGIVNQNPTWVAPTQGNTQMHGISAPNPSFTGPIQGNANQNVGWVVPSANVNTGWAGGQGNTIPTWSNNNLMAQQNQTVDGQSHSGMPPWSGEGSSRPPPMSGENVVCIFHESGHCRKGVYCNYRHF